MKIPLIWCLIIWRLSVAGCAYYGRIQPRGTWKEDFYLFAAVEWSYVNLLSATGTKKIQLLVSSQPGNTSLLCDSSTPGSL